MNKILFLAGVLMLTSCDQKAPGSDNVIGETVVPKNDNDKMVSQSFDIPAPFEELDTLTPAGIIVGNVGDNSITIGGLLEDPESGQTTGGYAIKLPEEVEQSVSGKKIQISIFLEGTSESNTAFRVAYSTAEVGNSGWITFDAQGPAREHSFEYDVSPMKKGRGDYVGFDPMGGTFVISALKITLLD